MLFGTLALFVVVLACAFVRLYGRVGRRGPGYEIVVLGSPNGPALVPRRGVGHRSEGLGASTRPALPHKSAGLAT
jgi:hypothetical protein